MALINPAVVIISTDKLDPSVDAEDDYKTWTEHVYSTREHGTIWVRMYDDGSSGPTHHGRNATRRAATLDCLRRRPAGPRCVRNDVGRGRYKRTKCRRSGEAFRER